MSQSYRMVKDTEEINLDFSSFKDTWELNVIVKQNEHNLLIVPIKGDQDLAMWLYDQLQGFFKEYVNSLATPRELRGGIGRRYDWL